MPKITQTVTTPPTKTAKTGTILDRIKPMGFDDTDGIKIVIYGQSGSGKTKTWSSFPKPILSLVCSGGKKPGELRTINTPEMRKVVDTLTISKPEDVKEIVELLQSGKGRVYNTVVLDHLTGLQDYVLRGILKLEKLPEQLSWGLATQTQWGQCALQTKEYARHLLDLNCNVVMVAQEREFKSDEELSDMVLPWIGPDLTPKTTGWLNQAVDYICQTYKRPQILREEKEIIKGQKTVLQIRTKKVEYCLRTGPHPVYMTKFRLTDPSKLPDEILNPTYDQIIKIIKG